VFARTPHIIFIIWAKKFVEWLPKLLKENPLKEDTEKLKKVVEGPRVIITLRASSARCPV